MYLYFLSAPTPYTLLPPRASRLAQTFGIRRKEQPFLDGRPTQQRHVPEGAALVMPRCDAEAMNLHRAEIATRITPGAHVTILVDQAGWRLSAGPIAPPNVTPIPPPAKCPDLNPQENVWRLMRENQLSGRVFKSFDDRRNHARAAGRRSTLIDSDILTDILGGDPHWSEHSARQPSGCAKRGRIAINDIVYAELVAGRRNSKETPVLR